MDCFTPTQHELIQRCFTLPFHPQTQHPTCSHTSAETLSPQDISPESHRRSAIRAFWALALLNGPICIGMNLLAIRRSIQAASDWTRWSGATIFGRYLSYPLEYVGFKRWFIRRRAISLVALDRSKWMSRLGLQTSSLAEGRYWAVLSSSFSHVDLGHLAGNMVSLWQFAPICAAIPGFNALHVWGVALFSSLVSSMAGLVHMTYFPAISNAWVASGSASFGFSGVNMAFMGVAAFGSPRTSVIGESFVFVIPCWLVCSVTVVADLYGAFHILGIVRRGFWMPKNANVGHFTHLAGFTAGALYYLVFSRIHSRRQSWSSGQDGPWVVDEDPMSQCISMAQTREKSQAEEACRPDQATLSQDAK